MNLTHFISKIKQLGIGRTNRFRMNIAVPKALTGKLTKLMKTTVNEHLSFTVGNASIPSKTISTNSVLAPGAEQKYPYAPEMEDITISFVCTREYAERKFIDAWMNEVVQMHGGSFTIGYRKDYETELKLQVFDEHDKQIDQIDFSACFPLSASAIELTQEEQTEMPTFEVVFQIDYWSRPISSEWLDKIKDPPKTTPET